MTNRTIEERCNFDTQRLSVSSWTNQILGLDSKNRFAKKVIEILTPNVTKTLPVGWQNISTLDGAKKWINERGEESHFMTIKLSSTKEIIGFIFLYESDTKDKYYDLRFGYLLSERVWDNGLGTELIDALIKWCIKEGDIKRISGGVEKDNIGSIKVLEKTGFSVSKTNNPTEEVIFYEYQFGSEEY